MYMIIRGWVRRQLRRLRELFYYTLKAIYTAAIVILMFKLMEKFNGSF